ncbi:MAG: hypothetical protein IJF00_07025 [Bacteroidaceae bacterium]|nr:hypothetical protein [Bacteroidaceae bacterium]
MQKPKIEVLVSDATQYKFQMTIFGYNKNTVYENDTPYEQISVDNWMPLGKVGEPAIPMFTQFIGLPANNICTVAISDAVWVTMPVGKIYPAQEAREESDTTEYSFTINDSLYNASEYETEEYFIGEEACIGGIYGIPLSVIPFKYYPNRNEIDVLKSCIVTVSFSQSSVINGNLSIKNKKLVESIVDNCNSDLLNTYNIPAVDSINSNLYDYLIITADQYKNTNALKEFCAWKRIKGHNCKIVSCSEVCGNKPDSIKACIKQWYEKGVEYVLFVGNKNDIAVHNYIVYPSKILVPSDYWYVCVDDIKHNIEKALLPEPEPLPDDIYADLAFGRFPVLDVNDLEAIVRKTIEYENYTTNDTWLTKNLLISHQEGAPSKYQACSEEIRTATYNSAPRFTTAYGADCSRGGNNATNDNVVSYINEGFGLVNYRGHGVTNGWKDDWSYQNISEFNYNYTQKLSNKKYPVVFSVACETGNIVVDPLTPIENPSLKSLLYNFIFSEYAAVAFVGATIVTSTEINNLFNKYLYKLLYNDKAIYSLGGLNVAAHINVLYLDDGKTKEDAFSYICGGDPSLEIWTDTISKFPNIDIAYEDGALSLNTRSIEKYTVTLFSQTDSNYFKKVTVADCDTIITNVPESFVMSFNKHNYMPLVYKVTDGNIYMQNENFALVRKLVGNNVYIGSDVTSTKPQGDVVVKSGAELSIDAKGKTVISKGFKIEQGAKIIIK